MNKGAAIIVRAIAPTRGDLSAAHARYLLKLSFTRAEHARYAKLADKAQQGQLTSAQADELDAFLSADTLISALKAKARASLRRGSPSPGMTRRHGSAA